MDRDTTSKHDIFILAVVHYYDSLSWTLKFMRINKSDSIIPSPPQQHRQHLGEFTKVLIPARSRVNFSPQRKYYDLISDNQ